jgi:plastocyanin
MTVHRLALALVSLAIPVAFAACGGTDPEPAQSAQSAGGGMTVDTATAGSLSGRVTFTGTPPEPAILRMGTDPACITNAGPNPQSDAVLIAADGGLQNAFVYVKEGLDEQYSFPIPTGEVELDQVGCRYTPRVIGVRAGQPMAIINSDPTLHNVHAMPMENLEFNEGQPTQGWRTTKTFTVPEVMVRFKCNVHNWMAAYVGVMAHPYFAVTSADGSFEIRNLPPGTYTIEAWHETFGTRTVQVTIAERQAQTASLTFTQPD